MESCPCNVCGEGGHHPRRCPSLASPLELGFYRGQIPRGGGGEEEDDEHLRVGNQPMTVFLHSRNFRISHKPIVVKQCKVRSRFSPCV